METIKVSLKEPIQALNKLDVDWGRCKEKDGVLTLVLKSTGGKTLSVGDDIIFRRSVTKEEEATNELNSIIEEKVRVVSVSEKSVKVTAPQKKLLICSACTKNEELNKYVITSDKEHTIFYQDVAFAETIAPIKAVFNDTESKVYATQNNLNTIGVETTYIKHTMAIGDDCGGDEIVPYDYYFLPIRESRIHFLCDDEIPLNSVISFNQNDFYCVDSEYNCFVWSDERFTPNGEPQTKVEVFKDEGYWNVPIGFVQNADYVHLFQEERINTLFAEKVKKGLIPEIINMEKVKYAPVIIENDEISLVCGITFNLHFRVRDDNWNVNRNKGWNTCDPTDTRKDMHGDFITKDFTKSDSLYYLNFNDSDVQYQKMKVKKSFIRLSFYSSNDVLDQKLLYYSTIFFDSGSLFGNFNKKRTELIENGYVWDGDDSPQFVLSHANDSDSDIRIDSQIVVHNEFDYTKSSDGFNLYLFADDSEIVDQDKEYRTIYMKVEFNHAGNGKTVPFMTWPEGESSDGVSIEKYFENVYIPLKIQHIKDRYYYCFDSTDYVKCDKENRSIVFNLFEPKIIRES